MLERWGRVQQDVDCHEFESDYVEDIRRSGPAFRGRGIPAELGPEVWPWHLQSSNYGLVGEMEGCGMPRGRRLYPDSRDEMRQRRE